MIAKTRKTKIAIFAVAIIGLLSLYLNTILLFQTQTTLLELTIKELKDKEILIDALTNLPNQVFEENSLIIYVTYAKPIIMHYTLIYYLSGYVQNVGASNASNFKIFGVFFNSTGKIVTVQPANLYTGPFGLQGPIIPGQNATFAIYITSDAEKISSYYLTTVQI